MAQTQQGKFYLVLRGEIIRRFAFTKIGKHELTALLARHEGAVRDAVRPHHQAAFFTAMVTLMNAGKSHDEIKRELGAAILGRTPTDAELGIGLPPLPAEPLEEVSTPHVADADLAPVGEPLAAEPLVPEPVPASDR